MTTNEINTNLDSLTSRLRKEDKNYATLMKVVQVIYLAFIPIYAVLTTSEYVDSKEKNVLISGACAIAGFIVFIVLFRVYYKDYKYVDYSLPTLQLLKKAVYRYQPFQWRALWVLLALVLMDFGLTLSWLDEGISIAHSQAFFGGAILLGLIIGLVWWYIKYKPLRDDALKLLKELEG